MSEPSHCEKEEDYSAYSLKDLIVAMRLAREHLDGLKKAVAEAQKHYDHLSTVLVPERMTDEGIDNIRYDGIGRISVRADLRVSVKADHRQELYDWLEERDYESLIVPTVNSSTLKAWVKEQIAAGRPVPEDLLNIYAYERATITRT